MTIRFKPLLSSIFIMLIASLMVACPRPDVIVPPGPPDEGFLLGPEDELEVVVWKNQDLSKRVVIRPDGKVSLPLIGDVPTTGLTADQLAEEIEERYKAFKENPAVSVNVVAVNSYYVFVVGEVNSPGKLQMKSYTTILQAISLAGGFTQFAGQNDIRIIRNVINGEGKVKELRIPIRYDDLISDDGAAYNVTLQSGDTIVVP